METTVLVPTESVTRFIDYIHEKYYEETQNYISYENSSNNGIIYELVFHKDRDVHWFAEIWKEKTGNEAIFISDNSVILLPAERKMFFRGRITNTNLAYEEETWRDKIELVVNEIPTNDLIGVVFNLSNSRSLKKYFTPTILLTGSYIHRDENGLPTLPLIKVLIYGKKSFLVEFKNWAEFSQYQIVQNYNNDNIVFYNDIFIVIKNSNGYGNTVLLNETMFSQEENNNRIEGMLSLLENKEIWEQILIPLATMDFDAAKEMILNQDIPLWLQLKVFALSAQDAAAKELVQLKEAKINHQNNIDFYVRSITDAKLLLTKAENELREKEKQFYSKATFKNLLSEIKKTLTLPFIEDIKMDNEGIKFYTEPIQIDEGPILGGYEIIYKPKDRKLRIVNPVNPVNPHGELLMHPHLTENYSCFGNYTDILYRFEVGEYYIGLTLLHKFLSTYNPEDEWGRRLIYWDAEYVFRDMEERGILYQVESEYNDYYYDIYGEYLPDSDVCSGCGELRRNCDCDRCSYCDALIEDCECNLCECCNYPRDECECYRCPNCGELWERNHRDCDCERCEDCECLVDDCECERCDIDGELLSSHDPEDDMCMNCEEECSIREAA